MNYLQSLGSIAIASRLKSLSDQLVRDMDQVYKKQKIEFEPRWFTFFHLIYHAGPLSITEIAREINQSHPAANQVANALEKKGLIQSIKDKKDHRKRIIVLTNKGNLLANQLKPVWQAVETTVDQLLEESNTQLLEKIITLEQLIKTKPIEQRILVNLKTIQKNKLSIKAYETQHKDHFKNLNEAWLKEYFEIEPEDSKLLDNPETQIIDKGGLILFVLMDEIVIGTAALLKHDKHTCELTKMAVLKEYQGLKAGRLLLRAMIDEARSSGYDTMILLTGEILHKAVSLYKSEGFVLSEQDTMLEHNLKRCSIQMELNLKLNSTKN